MNTLIPETFVILLFAAWLIVLGALVGRYNLQNTMNVRTIAVGQATFDKQGEIVYNNDNIKFILTGQE